MIFIYRARKNGLQNIFKKEPRQGQAEKSRNSRKEFHQTMYKPFFEALYVMISRMRERLKQMMAETFVI